jgi:hypothetical protein
MQKTGLFRGRKIALHQTLDVRFNEFVSMADKLGYTVLLQFNCLKFFGHSDFQTLTNAQKELLMAKSEPIVIEAQYSIDRRPKQLQ